MSLAWNPLSRTEPKQNDYCPKLCIQKFVSMGLLVPAVVSMYSLAQLAFHEASNHPL